MDESLRKKPTESQDQYFYRMCNMKESLGFTWVQLAEILNEELGNNFGESVYRKKYKSFKDVFEENAEMITGNDEIREQIRELEKERKKLQTEKIEYNKWLREEARDEMIKEAIVDAVKSLKPLEFPPVVYNNNRKYERSAILCLADAHFGIEFEILGLHGEVLNEYSPEIFEKRMGKLFDQTVQILHKEGIKTLTVYSLGDECDGILRVSQLNKLRYGVVESAVKYANYISCWLNDLSKYVKIRFQSVKGNHTELRMLGQPKGTFQEDNVALFINEIIKTRLEGNSNFEMAENPTGLIFDNICGFNVLGIHGEVKNLSNAIKDFSNTYNTMIDILIGGHMHHLSEETVAINKDVISVPSIIGIDDFSMKLNKTSNPGASLFFVEENKGITQEYRIKL